jgi:calcineurin-like phosphoesterase family protein
MGRTFITSDLHFDHTEIIGFCNRPFKNVEEMNKVLLANWNNTVGPEDTVYFLGDLACGEHSKGFDYWKGKLNGNLTCIKGNHDLPNYPLWNIISYKTRQFLILHDPYEYPIKWQGWTIHGHMHNIEVGPYPFINGLTKTINVSIELTDYKPLNLDYILSLDLEHIRRQQTILDTPLIK